MPGADKDGAKREMENVTYLGVTTASVSPALSAQLGLPKEVGLVVTRVAPDSPAAAVLKEHDILTKLDDQILIDTHQLSVLVRARQEGDDVTLTLYRAGKEMTVKAKLAKHEVARTAGDFRPFEFGGDGFNFQLPNGSKNLRELPGMRPEDTDRVMRLIQNARDRALIDPAVRSGSVIINRHRVRRDGDSATIIDLPRSNLVYSDDDGVLELNSNDGRRELTAKNAQGDVLFQGSVNTEEERKKVPAEVLSRLDKLEKMDGFGFEIRDGFQHEGMTVGQPYDPVKIQLPQRRRPESGDPGSRPF